MRKPLAFVLAAAASAAVSSAQQPTLIPAHVRAAADRISAAQPSQAALDQLVADYCLAWTDPDPERRRALLSKVWAAGGTYTDPIAHVEGQDALLEFITGFHQRFPGVKILVTSHADFHHGTLRFSWRMVEGSGATRIDGMDFAELSTDGRIKRIVGFFGPFKPK